MEIHSRHSTPLRKAVYLIILLLIIAVPVFLFILKSKPSPQPGSELLDFPDFSQEEIPQLHLNISPTAWEKLSKKREIALKTGILSPESKGKVKIKLGTTKATLPAKLRLKGDWVDHLRGRKWSYRIKLKSGGTWNRLNNFSLMTPEARDFLNEWIFHKLLRHEGVLTPRYDFVALSINDRSYGIYAWEEHFTKQLLESQNRREGPIVKLVEDHLWEMRDREVRGGCRFIENERILEGAIIRPFKTNKTISSPTLRPQFLQAQILLQQYQKGLSPASEIFDLDLLGKWLALTDIARCYHGLIWHNQRFYYNPVTARLEPIGFDGDTGGHLDGLIEIPLIGLGDRTSSSHPAKESILLNQLFDETEVQEKYQFFLQKYSEPGWLENVLKQWEAPIQQREKWLAKEYPGYHHEIDLFLKNSQNIRQILHQMRVDSTEQEVHP